MKERFEVPGAEAREDSTRARDRSRAGGRRRPAVGSGAGHPRWPRVLGGLAEAHVQLLLAGVAVAPDVHRDDPVRAGEFRDVPLKELVVHRPAVDQEDRGALPPVGVVDRHPVLGGQVRHPSILPSRTLHRHPHATRPPGSAPGFLPLSPHGRAGRSMARSGRAGDGNLLHFCQVPLQPYGAPLSAEFADANFLEPLKRKSGCRGTVP